MTTTCARLTAAAALSAIALTASLDGAAGRPMSIEDLLGAVRVADPQLSPDGRTVLYTRTTTDVKSGRRNSDIYGMPADGSAAPKAMIGGDRSESTARFSPDGTRIAYAVSSTKDGTYAIDWRRADSSGDAQRLLENTNRVYPSSWHPSGKFLAYVEQTASGGVIRILSMEGSEAAGWKPGTSSAFVTTSGSQQEPLAA